MIRTFVSPQAYVAISTMLVAGLAYAQDRDNARSAAPDNTRVNKRDRSDAERTADQAKETPMDREIMQKIRKAIVSDKTLSTYAHNAKIISEHGKVTLKGPVRSEEESKNIEGKAVAVAGRENVTNQLTIAPAKNQ